MKPARKEEERNLIGDRVRIARQSCIPPVSQYDLAGKLAAKGILMDRTAISRIESKARYVMDHEALALAEVHKVSVAWLFGESDSLPARIRKASKKSS